MGRPFAGGRGNYVALDMQSLHDIREIFGATQEQMLMAYTRALRRTEVTLRKKIQAIINSDIAPENKEKLRKRLMSFRTMRAGRELGDLKLWFGLNQFRVKDLKGTVVGDILPHHVLRDPYTGRFARGPQAAGPPPAFKPKGGALSSKVWPGGFIRRDDEGRKRIYTRRGNYAREATINAHAGLLDVVEGDIFRCCWRPLCITSQQRCVDVRAWGSTTRKSGVKDVEYTFNDGGIP